MWTVRKVIIVLSVAGLCGGGLIYLSIIMPSTLWSRITNNIGLALIVSCIVGIVMELYLREQMKLQMGRMLKEVGTNVFKAALGHEFPDSVWEQVSNHLLLNQFLRRDLTIDCILENSTNGEEGFIKDYMCISYKLINLNTVQSRHYPFACSIDRCTHSKLRDATKFNSIKIGSEEVDVEKECKISADEAEITCRRWIELKPGEEIPITINSESEHTNRETIPFSVTDPTENFTIHITKPSNIAVAVDAIHPREERLVEEPTASSESQRRWRIKGGLLPGNGVTVHWFPS